MMAPAIKNIRCWVRAFAPKRETAILFGVLALTCAFALCLIPSPAHASIFGDLLGLDDWIKGLFCGMVNSLFTWVFSILKSISATDLLTGSWQDLFGGNTNVIYRFATDICNGIVKPIGATILAFVMLVQLVQISSKMDQQGGTFPTVREVLVLAVFYTIFVFLIGNADKLCELLYDILNNISTYIANYQPGWTADISSVAFVEPEDIGSVTVGDFLVALIVTLFTFLAAIIAYVVAILMAYARAIQLYLYMTFSPIPLALMGFDGTRQMGVGFLKGFASVCIAGSIMLFVLIAFPFIVVSVVDFGVMDAMGVLGLSAILNLLKVLAVCLLLIFALIKSGSTARDILGG